MQDLNPCQWHSTLSQLLPDALRDPGGLACPKICTAASAWIPNWDSVVPPRARSSFCSLFCIDSDTSFCRAAPESPTFGCRTRLPSSGRKFLPAANSRGWVQARWWREQMREEGSILSLLSSSSSALATSLLIWSFLSTQGQFLSTLPWLQVLLYLCYGAESPRELVRMQIPRLHPQRFWFKGLQVNLGFKVLINSP